MAKAKLTVSVLTVQEAIDFMQLHDQSMTGNANFATPEPTAVDFNAARTALADASTAYEAAKLALENLLEQRDAALATAKAMLVQRMDYVNLKSGGDSVKITSSGFSVRSTPAPIGPLAAPQNVVVFAGDNEGSVIVKWEPVRGAMSYQLEHTTDPNVASSWVNHTNTTRSEALYTGLVSGTRMWFRVRGLGAAGEGAWSDPAVKTVP